MKKNILRLMTLALILALCLSAGTLAYASDVIIIGGGDNGGGGVEIGTDGTAQAAVVTKSPTGETVNEGEDALFIAYAEHYDDILWIIASPDGKTYEGKAAANAFAGLVVSGYTEEELLLEKIPYDMNGFTVQCRFTGEDGVNVYTDKAKITVNKVEINTALINSEPQAASLKMGETAILTVTATSPNSGSLKYQWYKNTENKTEGGTAISGAVNANYTPDQLAGTFYYYVGVWNIVGNQTSQAVYTKPVPVTYADAQSAGAQDSDDPQQAESETPEESRQPVMPTANRPGVDSEENTDGNTMLMVISIVLCVAVLAAVAALIIIRRKEKELNDEYEDDEDDEFYKP